MKEVVILSGKGGTGKTSVTASFAALARNAVMADCDVDAADLHLVLSPEVRRREIFVQGNLANVRTDACDGCGRCRDVCRFGAVRMDAGRAVIDPLSCEGCGVCVWNCPRKAIDFPERECGEWFVSETRFGPMVHARLWAAAENSGKLVSLVRREARREAEEGNRELLISDGPPGVGCPVIASLTGADATVIVTEPKMSGEHDMQRVLELARHFKVPAYLCVNKWDINPAMALRIERLAARNGVVALGRISYDSGVTEAQVRGVTVIEYDKGAAAAEIRSIFGALCSALKSDARKSESDPKYKQILKEDLRT